MALTSDHFPAPPQRVGDSRIIVVFSHEDPPKSTFIPLIHMECGYKPGKRFSRQLVAFEGSRHSILQLTSEIPHILASFTTVPQIFFDHLSHCCLTQVAVIAFYAPTP